MKIHNVAEKQLHKQKRLWKAYVQICWLLSIYMKQNSHLYRDMYTKIFFFCLLTNTTIFCRWAIFSELSPLQCSNCSHFSNDSIAKIDDDSLKKNTHIEAFQYWHVLIKRLHQCDKILSTPFHLKYIEYFYWYKRDSRIFSRM